MICSKCKQDLPVSEFYKDKAQAREYRYECKKCAAILSKESHQKHWGKVKVRHYEWIKENKEKYDAYQKPYMKEYGQRPEVKAKNRKAQKRWEQTPRGRILNRLKCSRRRKRERHLINDLTYVQVLELFHEQNNCCAICKKPFEGDNWEFDHIVPVSKSQAGDPGLTKSNIQLTHGKCNKEKGSKL